jgi:hypothetical protein
MDQNKNFLNPSFFNQNNTMQLNPNSLLTTSTSLQSIQPQIQQQAQMQAFGGFNELLNAQRNEEAYRKLITRPRIPPDLHHQYYQSTQSNVPLNVYNPQLRLPIMQHPYQMQQRQGAGYVVDEDSSHRSDRTKLFIGNLPKNVQLPELLERFSKYGRINDKLSVVKEDYAFIHFYHEEDARRALEAENDSLLRDGRYMRVQYSTSTAHMKKSKSKYCRL